MTQPISNLRSQISDAGLRPELRRAYQQFGAPEGFGPAIMADLDETFGGNPFAAGQADLTAYRCGALAVVQYLYEQMARAAAPEPQQETSL